MNVIQKALLIIGLFGSIITAEHAEKGNLRADDSSKAATAPLDSIELVTGEHLDLELVVEGGERELFPLLPGTRCPAGHICRTRTTSHDGISPMIGSLKNSMYGTKLAMSLDWVDLNANLKTTVISDNYCTRRQAMTRAAGLAAGLGLAAVSSPAYAAETKEVKMGSDTGLLAFVPQKTTICKGDSVKWINNKSGPHNVVFDVDNIPSGVDQEAISMIDDQIGEEGEFFEMKFDVAGEYAYYCEPHRGAGMNGMLVVT